MTDRAAFIRANTAWSRMPLVPEIGLFLATEITPIWQATEAWLTAHDTAPPFWAFAWPGSQALARLVLDDPSLVRGRRVLDFASGCGLAAIACAQAGAAQVEAADIDPLALDAIRLNAAANGVGVTALQGDVVGSACRWDLVVCGDVCYEAPMARQILPWLRAMAASAEVWIADPGRAYVPHEGLRVLRTTTVATTLELEGQTERRVTIFQLKGEVPVLRPSSGLPSTPISGKS